MFKYFLKTIIYNFTFQEAISPIMEGITDFHNYCFIYLIIIFSIIVWMLLYILFSTYWIWIYYNFTYYYPNIKTNPEYDTEIAEKYLLYIFNPPQYDYNNFFFNFYDLELRTYQNFIKEFNDTRHITQYVNIEIIWTIFPILIIILLAIPSFILLYSIDEINNAQLTFKVIGYQWYWTYEFAHFFNFIEYDYLHDSLAYNFNLFHDFSIYDSLMINDLELNLGNFRLLDVDNIIILPIKMHIRVLVTAMDVIHSWAIPSLGIKIDAVPGRINQVGIFINRIGVFYGQCSELCGINHGFMPIVIKGVEYSSFLEWFFSPWILFTSYNTSIENLDNIFN